jgi:hypothetical protein
VYLLLLYRTLCNSLKSCVLVSPFSNQRNRVQGGWVTWPNSPRARIQFWVFLTWKLLTLASLLYFNTWLSSSYTSLSLTPLLPTVTWFCWIFYPYSPSLSLNFSLPGLYREAKTPLGFITILVFFLPRNCFPAKWRPCHSHAPMPGGSGTEQSPPPGSDWCIYGKGARNCSCLCWVLDLTMI